MVGHAVHPEEALMAAGLDSRGGMELRRTLAEAIGMQLPVTLLYDHQSINAIVDFINTEVSASGVKGSAPADGSDAEDIPDSQLAATSRPATRALAASGKPSELLKTLRPAPAQRALFLAAPGVANAQSAYFSFSMFLQWSSQPIYVLDKDNDLNVSQLALQNAADILLVQPEGPYLLGGHSYGGCVALEIAMVLEGWGHEVGLVLVGAHFPPWSCPVTLHSARGE